MCHCPERRVTLPRRMKMSNDSHLCCSQYVTSHVVLDHIAYTSLSKTGDEFCIIGMIYFCRVCSDPWTSAGYCTRENKNKSQKTHVHKEGFRKCIFKWERHHIWHLFLQVTTHAVWIMGAAVPSVLPSQEAECVPALTTRFWRRTMSPVQVGGQNESDRARGLRSSCPSILPSWLCPMGQRLNNNLI